MSSFSDDDDDMLLSKLDLDGIVRDESFDKGNSTSVTNQDPEVDEFDDDNDILFLEEIVSENCEKPSPLRPKHVIGTPKPRPQLSSHSAKPTTSRTLVTVSRNDKIPDDWKEFNDWFERQDCFQTGWFQTTPVFYLNQRLCQDIIQGCKDHVQLLRILNLVIKFVRDVDGAPEDCEYFLDMSHVLEIIFTKLESDTVPDLSANQSQFNDAFKEITEDYIKGKLKLGATEVPQSLINVYPRAVEDIASSCIKTGKPDLLLPVILKRPGNFIKVFTYLQKEANADESDSDFQDENGSYQVARRLLDLLNETEEHLKTIPIVLLPLYAFQVAVNKCSDHDQCKSNVRVIDQALSLVNNLICTVQSDNFYELRFVQFLITLLPFFNSILDDKQLMKTVQFKTHPFLWTYSNKLGQFGH